MSLEDTICPACQGRGSLHSGTIHSGSMSTFVCLRCQGRGRIPRPSAARSSLGTRLARRAGEAFMAGDEPLAELLREAALALLEPS